MLVSVVIPTYNPGHYIDAAVDSLLAQTLDADQYEIIVVDDGSTDGSPRHLDELAARHPNLVVVHSEHSGWPGRPRNIGIERARGEFIQFVDQDDRMAPDGLRRLTDMGRCNGSDIVLGKVASDFRGVALGLYAANRDVCTIHDAPLISSLTPHKMFRRSFLDETGIRFPEGPRRLEDQLFVVKAYFAARVISIVADEPLYFYLRRDDDGNAGSDPTWDPVGYFDNLREVLDVVVANTEPGPERARLMRRFCRAQLVGRRFQNLEPDFRARVFAAVRGVLIDYVDPDVDAGLGAVMALRARLIREDRLDDLVILGQRTAGLGAPSTVESIDWVAGRLRIVFTAEVAHGDGTPSVFIRRDGRTALDPRVTRDIVPGTIDVTDELGGFRLLTMLRERSSGVEWSASTWVTLEWLGQAAAGGAGETRLVLHGTSEIDPAFVANGGRITPGDWTWRTRVAAFGLSLEGALGGATPPGGRDLPPLPQLLDADLLVTPHLASGVGVTLDVVRVAGRPPGQSVYRRPIWSTWRIRSRLDGAVRRVRTATRPARTPIRLVRAKLRGRGPRGRQR